MIRKDYSLALAATRVQAPLSGVGEQTLVRGVVRKSKSKSSCFLSFYKTILLEVSAGYTRNKWTAQAGFSREPCGNAILQIRYLGEFTEEPVQHHFPVPIPNTLNQKFSGEGSGHLHFVASGDPFRVKLGNSGREQFSLTSEVHHLGGLI